MKKHEMRKINVSYGSTIKVGKNDFINCKLTIEEIILEDDEKQNRDLIRRTFAIAKSEVKNQLKMEKRK